MELLKNFFMRSPGGENEGSAPSTENNDAPKEGSDIPAEGEHHQKGFIEKVKDALKDWSNQDAAEQDFDDTQA